MKTSRVRNKIRQWIRKQEFDSAVQLGEDFLERELKKVKESMPSEEEALKKAAESVGYQEFD